MERLKHYGETNMTERIRAGITVDTMRQSIEKVFKNLVDLDNHYGREVTVDLAQKVDALLVEAHEILTEFIADNEEETE